MDTTIMITVLAILCVVLTVTSVYLYLHSRLSEEMLASKDKIILFYQEMSKTSDAQVLSKLQKILDALKKE